MYQVKCPECGGDRSVQARKSWMVGSPPFLKICKACCQKGKEKTHECRLKISASMKKTKAKSEPSGKERVSLEKLDHLYPDFLSSDMVTIKCGVEGCDGVETLRKASAALNIKKNGVFKCRTCCFTEEGRKKISKATSYKRSQETCDKMAKAKKAFYDTEKGKELKKKLSVMTAENHSTNKYEKSKRRGVFQSQKTGRNLSYDSSYELRLCWMLEQDDNVLDFETQIGFRIDGHGRCLDCLVTYKGGRKKAIEVKPKQRLDEFAHQIDDSRRHALQNGWEFQVMTEEGLGMTYEQIRTWADEYRTKVTGIDYHAYRDETIRTKSKKYYDTHIATDKVQVYCEYCGTTHEALRLTHDKNIARNGRYICEREGGHIAGSRPKKKKVNPYEAEGKKECLGCKQVLPFDNFGTDKGRRDGYASKCKECRRVAANEKYAGKKMSES